MSKMTTNWFAMCFHDSKWQMSRERCATTGGRISARATMSAAPRWTSARRATGIVIRCNLDSQGFLVQNSVYAWKAKAMRLLYAPVVWVVVRSG